jgi:pSer/pThr/pTyr-binding forkhead associated (FHA) protein
MIEASRRQAPELKSPADVQAVLQAERRGLPFLLFRDGVGAQRIVTLDSDSGSLVIGRDERSDLCLGWDARVSSLHARLERAGHFWTLHDDGLSSNGSYVNGVRVHGHHVLNDGEELCFGETVLRYRSMAPKRGRTTLKLGEPAAEQAVSPAQRKVLIALCRPYKENQAFVRPASNQEIADELVLSVEAVKSHMRALFARFGLETLPVNEKRMRLVEHALQVGLVHRHEL